MAESRLIGGYPVIGIRPTIDGRRGALKVVNLWKIRQWEWQKLQKNCLKRI